MVLISMLLLNITLTLISTYKYYTPEYKAFEEEKQKLISLWSENPLAYDSLYEVHVEKVDSYNSLVRQTSIMGRASPEFENQYINSKEYDDIELFDSVEETIRKPTVYTNRIYNVVNDAYSRLQETEGNSFLEQYYKYLCFRYTKISNISLPVVDIKGWNEYFSLTYPTLLIILEVTATLSTIFVDDIKKGLKPIFHCTRNGEIKSKSYKLIVIFIVSSIIAIKNTVIPLLLLKFSSGLSPINLPVQIIDCFTLCPFALSISEYLMVSIILKILFTTTFSIVIAGIGAICESEYIAILFSLSLTISSILIARIPLNSQYYSFSKFSITKILDIKVLFEKFMALNIFNVCVEFLTFLIYSSLAIIIIFCLLILIFKYMDVKCVSLNSYAPKTRANLSLVRHELYKLLINNKALVVIAIFVVIDCLYAGIYFKRDESSSEVIYYNYLNYLEGDVTLSKLNYIDEEKMQIYDYISEYEIALSSYRAGKMDYNEYIEYKNRFNYAEYHKEAFERVLTRSEYLKNKIHEGHKNVAFIYDDGIMKYLDYSNNLILIVSSIVVCSPFFSMEYSTRFNYISRVTKNGRKKLRLRKSYILLLFCSIMFLIDCAIKISFLICNYKSALLSVPIQSIPIFSYIDYEITVFMYIILYVSLSYCGYLLFCGFTASMSILIESSYKCFIICFIIYFIPWMLNRFDFSFINIPSFSCTLNPTHFFSSISSFAVSIIALLFTLYYSRKKWNL